MAAESVLAEVAEHDSQFEPQSRSIIGSSFPENGEYELVEFERNEEVDQEDGDMNARSSSQRTEGRSEAEAPGAKSRPASVKVSSKRGSRAKKPGRSVTRSNGNVVRRATAPVRKVIRKLLPF